MQFCFRLLKFVIKSNADGFVCIFWLLFGPMLFVKNFSIAVLDNVQGVFCGILWQLFCEVVIKGF